MHLFVDNLTNVDFSYLCPERGLLGQTWLTHVEMDGKLDEQGMVCDFGTVKQVLRQWLDTEIDHRLLVPLQADNLTLAQHGDDVELNWRFGDGLSLSCRSPREALCLVETTLINPTHMAQWSVAQLASRFPSSVVRLQLGFTEERIDGPCYHYSHGLKKHGGNCQRIAHGHRSRIHIWQNGRQAVALEKQWAARWRDIYIGSREDLVGAPQHHGVPCYRFAYTAQQGRFELTLPQACCYLIDTDSTVEYIASHIAATLKLQHPHTVIKVKAYEGLGKGAIAEH